MPLRRGAGLHGRLLLLAPTVALVVYGGYLYRHICFAVGGSDSSGYANAARGVVRGALVVPIDGLERFDLPASLAPAFTPLGYVALTGRRAMAPLYPVGFPLHLSAAGAVFGWERAPYLVSPLAAVLCLVLIHAVGRELGLSRWASAAGALVLAACPVFVFQAVQPMSDVVATFWGLAAVWAALRARRGRTLHAAAAGFAFGIAVLVRPMDALLLLPLLFALPFERRALLGFGLGCAPLAAALLGYDVLCFGAPFRTGYGLTGLWTHFSRAFFPAHLLRYVRWTADVLTPLVALGWLAAPFDRRLPRRDRALLLSWFGVFLLGYSFYEPGDAWWWTRFLLPGLPAAILGFLLVARDLAEAARPRWRTAAAAVAALVIVLSALLGFRHARLWGALGLSSAQRVFPDACRRAGESLPPDALVLSMEMSGALRYYTALTPVRWDALDAGSFAALRQATERRGAAWYALLLRSEVAEAAPRVPGRWTHLWDERGASLWRLDDSARP